MIKAVSAGDMIREEMENDLELRNMVAEEAMNSRIAQEIYDLRTKAGLTQKELARRVGTTQPVIARLEDADYRGHSLRMLVRIAFALGKVVEVRFAESPRQSRAKRKAAS